MSELSGAWTLESVKALLDKAHAVASNKGAATADRILDNGDLRSALDWLVTQQFKSQRTEMRLVVLSTAVLNATKLMPPLQKGGEQIVSIGHVRKFDQACRDLRAFIDKLAARAAKA